MALFFAFSAGASDSMLTDPAMEVSGLRISCAMAAASRPDRSQTVLHAHFALQTPDFSQIVETVDITEIAASR